MTCYTSLQAIGPELTFYTASKDVGDSPILRNKLLHAQLDAFGRLDTLLFLFSFSSMIYYACVLVHTFGRMIKS